MTLQNYTKHPIKVLQNKNNMETLNLFMKRFPTLHLNVFILNVFNKGNLPEIQVKYFMSCI